MNSCTRILYSVLAFLPLLLQAQVPYFPDSAGVRVSRVSFNQESAEFAPVLYGNNLYFVSDRDYHFGVVKFRSAGRQFFDIYSARKKDSTHFEKPVHLPQPVNTPYNDGPLCFSTTGIYVTGNNRAFKVPGKKLPLQVSYLRSTGKDIYANAERISFGQHDTVSFGQAFVTGDTLMYLVSDMAGGFGGTDIYFSRKTNGAWQPPVNCGAQVNTLRNESFPHFKNGVLYFSSDREGGRGRLDIYASEKKPDGFAPARLLSPPLNGPADDFAFFLDDNGHTGYFSSSRDGDDNIFYFSADSAPAFASCAAMKFNQYCYTFFEENAKDDKDTAAIYYEWSFGDGKKVRGPEVYHCFEGAGKYTVELNVVDRSTGLVFFNQLSYEFLLKNEEQLYIDIPDTVKAGEEVDFSAAFSYVPGYEIKKYYWDFGDARFAYQGHPSHTYTKPGQYLVRLGAEGKLNGQPEKSCVTRYITVLDAASPVKTSGARRIPKIKEDEQEALSRIIDSILIADPNLFRFIHSKVKSQHNTIPDSVAFVKADPAKSIADSVLKFFYADPADTNLNYRVHLGSSEVPISPDDPAFKGLDSVSEIKVSRLYQYFYGRFKSPRLAMNAVKKVKDLGFSPFVFPFDRDSLSYSFNPAINNRFIRDTLQPLADSFTVAVYFRSSDFHLTDKDHEAIEKLTDRFCKFGCEFILSGYADSKGTSDYNLQLCRKRVNAVSEILQSKGVDKNKIRIRTLATLKNPGQKETDESLSHNRRVEIMLITK